MSEKGDQVGKQCLGEGSRGTVLSQPMFSKLRDRASFN